MTPAQTPATRQLGSVLREALAGGPGVRLIVCKDTTGKVAYVLAAPGRLLYLGLVAGYIDVVIEGETVNIPKLT